jgi:predicted nuclease of predicted toxin-antitoxin system
LLAAGHEAMLWSEVGDPRAPDSALMQWATANGYAVFIHDLDFAKMLILSGAEGPSVVQVRCLNGLLEAIGHLVLTLNSPEARGNQVARLGDSSWSACTTSGCSMTKVVPC